MKQKKSEQKKLGFDSKQKPEEQPQKQLSIDFENLKILGGGGTEEIYVQGYCDGEICTMNLDIALLTEMFHHYIDFKISNYESKGIDSKLARVIIEVNGDYNDEFEIPFYFINSFSEINKISY